MALPDTMNEISTHAFALLALALASVTAFVALAFRCARHSRHCTEDRIGSISFRKLREGLWILSALCLAVPLSKHLPFYGGFIADDQVHFFGWRVTLAATLWLFSIPLLIRFILDRHETIPRIRSHVILGGKWIAILAFGSAFLLFTIWALTKDPVGQALVFICVPILVINIVGYLFYLSTALFRKMAQTPSETLRSILIWATVLSILAPFFFRPWNLFSTPADWMNFSAFLLPVHALHAALASISPWLSAAVLGVILWIAVKTSGGARLAGISGVVLLSLCISIVHGLHLLPGSLNPSVRPPSRQGITALEYHCESMESIIGHQVGRSAQGVAAALRLSQAKQALTLPKSHTPRQARAVSRLDQTFRSTVFVEIPRHLVNNSDPWGRLSFPDLVGAAGAIEKPAVLYTTLQDLTEVLESTTLVYPDWIEAVAAQVARLEDAFGWRIELLNRLRVLADDNFLPEWASLLEEQASKAMPGPVYNLHGHTHGLVKIEPGAFFMGSMDGRTNERPVQVKEISRPFWIGSTAITVWAYEEVMMGMRSEPRRWNGDLYPVTFVSWEDAMYYCAELTSREADAGRLPPGYVYRLPTEAEWEFAASVAIPPGSPRDLRELGWFDANSKGKPWPVAQKTPNPRGLHDMLGNVWEWCLDTYADHAIALTSVTDPVHLGEGPHRVRRGGSWSSSPEHLRYSRRDGSRPQEKHGDLGFRICLGPDIDNPPFTNPL